MLCMFFVVEDVQIIDICALKMGTLVSAALLFIIIPHWEVPMSYTITGVSSFDHIFIFPAM